MLLAGAYAYQSLRPKKPAGEAEPADSPDSNPGEISG